MTPDPIIVSIPHTGTRFLKERLGIEDHIHTNTNWEKVWSVTYGRPIVAPMKAPAAVWRSWCRRHDGKALWTWAPQFFIAFGVMHTLDQMFDVDFICIDKQQDERITDWSKVGDSDGSHAHWKLHDVDLRVLFKLPFVQRHYQSWAGPVR